MRHTHGKCANCRVIYRWTGSIKLSEAYCPVCGWALLRTAANLARNIPVREEEPVRSAAAARNVKVPPWSARLSCGHLLMLHGDEARAARATGKPGRTAGCQVCKELGRTDPVTIARVL